MAKFKSQDPSAGPIRCVHARRRRVENDAEWTGKTRTTTTTTKEGRIAGSRRSNQSHILNSNLLLGRTIGRSGFRVSSAKGNLDFGIRGTPPRPCSGCRPSHLFCYDITCYDVITLTMADRDRKSSNH